MESKKVIWRNFLVFLVPIFVVWACVEFFSWTKSETPKDINDFGKAPSFNFQEQSGKFFDSSQLSGRVWLIGFIFTHCPTSCPLETQYLRRLQNRFKNQPDFRMVCCTVDPDTDTPSVLTQYANRLGADETKWLFLTGDKKDIYSLAKFGFKVTAQEDNSSGIPEFVHTTRVVLVDRQGVIRGYYDSLAPEDEKLLETDLKYYLDKKI